MPEFSSPRYSSCCLDPCVEAFQGAFARRPASPSPLSLQGGIWGPPLTPLTSVAFSEDYHILISVDSVLPVTETNRPMPQRGFFLKPVWKSLFINRSSFPLESYLTSQSVKVLLSLVQTLCYHKWDNFQVPWNTPVRKAYRCTLREKKNSIATAIKLIFRNIPWILKANILLLESTKIHWVSISALLWPLKTTASTTTKKKNKKRFPHLGIIQIYIISQTSACPLTLIHGPHFITLFTSCNQQNA